MGRQRVVLKRSIQPRCIAPDADALIAELRELYDEGVTYGSLAAEIGCTPWTVKYWLSGLGKPAEATARKIRVFLSKDIVIEG
jgi:hypothetical protein